MRNVFSTSRASIDRRCRRRLHAGLKPTRASETRSPAAEPPLLEAERRRGGRRAGEPARWPGRHPAPQRARTRARPRCRASRSGRRARASGRSAEPRERAAGDRSAATKRSSARRLRRRHAPPQRASSAARTARARHVAEEVGAATAAQDGAAGVARPLRDDLAEDSAAVLDVVVERPVDVRDVAGRQRDEPDPVVVELRARACRGTAARARAISRRNSVAAPVTVLATSSEARSVWLLRRPSHIVSRSTWPSASTRRWSE